MGGVRDSSTSPADADEDDDEDDADDDADKEAEADDGLAACAGRLGPTSDVEHRRT